MANKKFIYFVSLSSNAAYVIKQSLEMAKQQHEVAIFFDHDGERILDQQYFNNRNSAHDLDYKNKTNINCWVCFFFDFLQSILCYVGFSIVVLGYYERFLQFYERLRVDYQRFWHVCERFYVDYRRLSQFCERLFPILYSISFRLCWDWRCFNGGRGDERINGDVVPRYHYML